MFLISQVVYWWDSHLSFPQLWSIGIPYLNKQPMHILSSIWNGEDWATEGGRIKIDWTYAPFISRFRQFRPRACKWNAPISFAECTSTSAGKYWWNYPIFSTLNETQMQRVREEYMTYDYCKDTKRFSRNMPIECAHQPIQSSWTCAAWSLARNYTNNVIEGMNKPTWLHFLIN